MTTTKMAAQVTMHSESYGDSGHHPAVNVKVYDTDWPSAEQLAAQSGCAVTHAQRALEAAWEAGAEDFWIAANTSAKEIFGPSVEVYAEGRSGGWCSVYGLPEDVANWPAKLRRKWHAFESNLREEIAYRSTEAWALEIIEANDWLTPKPTDAEIIAELTAALKLVHDEADHILGTEADDALEVARVNAKAIKKIARAALAKV